MISAVGQVAVVAQCAAAGLVVGLGLQHWSNWRDDRTNASAFWLAVWSGAIALLFLVNGVIPALPDGPGADLALFVRAQVIAVVVVLALPTVRTFTNGPPLRWYVTAAIALFAARGVLWLTTDLISEHSPVAQSPRFGPFEAPTLFACIAGVAWYTLVATTRRQDSRGPAWLHLAAVPSFFGLVLAYVIPPGHVAELLKGAWVIPLVVALHVAGSLRAREADRREHRRQDLRDALTDVDSVAWLATDLPSLRVHVEAVAREQLTDPTLTCALAEDGLKPTSLTFASDSGLPTDDHTREFLWDLSRTVSVAAERMRLTEELRIEATTDLLTRLPNRKAFEVRLGQAYARAARNGDRLGLLYCDVDEFKRENDRYGHPWGDEVLRRTADHLRANLREGDFAARIGGDEFVVVVENARSRNTLLEVARRIRAGLVRVGNEQVTPLMSVGISMWEPGFDPDPEQLLREADAAMFEAKNIRVGIVVFDDRLRARMDAEQNLHRELAEALLADEFELHYQSIVSAADLQIIGVEALVRWQHPDGMRQPAQWLTFAENSGLIVPIGQRLLTIAREGASRLGLPVAVNVAARQLAEPRFVEHVRESWGDGDWDLLTLEITESALVRDLPHVVRSLTTLRALGVRISIDDFGTGYSSFARLAKLPVDVLKIDQAFVRDLDDPGGVAVVRAIVALAQAYELELVAEGVEQLDQLETLTTLGIGHVQGYLLGRPTATALLPVDLSAARAERQVRSTTAVARRDPAPVRPFRPGSSV